MRRKGPTTVDEQRSKKRYSSKKDFRKFTSGLAAKKIRKMREDDPDGIIGDTDPNYNPEDVVQMDIPLFIRLLEYAKEDAKTDMDLHHLADRAIGLSATGQVLDMSNYDEIVDVPNEETKRMTDLAGIRK